MIEHQFCLFTVGPYHFGLPVAHVQRILKHQSIYTVPLITQEFAGLVNLRGQITMAINLHHLFSIPITSNETAVQKMDPDTHMDPEAHLDTETDWVNIVILNDNEPILLIANTVKDVVTLDNSRIEEKLIGVIPDGMKSACQGIYRCDDDLVFLLDPQKLIHRVTQNNYFGEKHGTSINAN